jgi:Protein of Unknown function (DUF2784)
MSEPKNRAALRLLDTLLHLGHLAVIFFSAFGWLLPAARPLHLGLQGLILFSWFGLGYVKGWTYCFLTDLHWRVKQALQQPVRGDSYMKMLVDRISGRDADSVLINRITVTVFFFTTAFSLVLFLGNPS